VDFVGGLSSFGGCLTALVGLSSLAWSARASLRLATSRTRRRHVAASAAAAFHPVAVIAIGVGVAMS